jgi:predicted MFS family arabinose efflux permease
VLGTGAGGVAVLAAWTWRELRVDEPLLDPSIFTHRPLLLANLATTTAGFVAFSTYFVVPHLAEGPEGVSAHRAGYGFGANAAEAGLFLLPAAAGMVVTGPLSGPLTRRSGPRTPFLAGTTLMAVALVLLAAAHASPAPVYVALGVMGAGWGLTIGSASVLVARSVPRQATGVSTAFNSVMRLVGGGIGPGRGGDPRRGHGRGDEGGLVVRDRYRAVDGLRSRRRGGRPGSGDPPADGMNDPLCGGMAACDGRSGDGRKER